jgi:Tol biopolymer transport system component
VATSGHITYRLPSGDIYRIATQPGATPEDLTTELNRLSPGTVDETVNTSANGQWLVISTDRFGMSGWAGLAVVRADLSAGAAIQVNGAFFHGEGLNAVSSNGNLVVYSSDGGPHIRDLWAVTRVNGVWTGPQLLTANSPFAYNAQPCLSADGTRLLFDGGNAPTKTGSQAICEVRVDGSGLRQLVTEANAPAGADTTGRITTAAYAADGSIIFEASWTGDQIWRLAPGAAKAAPASGANNEVAPAVLPDGRIVSLWLDRAGNPNGSHELTVRAADGTYLFTLQPQVDVLDIGLGGGA